MRLGWLVSSFLVASTMSAGLHAQSVSTQNASIIGFGKTITLGWLPVINSSGKVIYKDVTITLSVDGAGNLTYATPKPAATLSPEVSPVAIKAGLYTQVGNSNNPTLKINGPQPVTSGGGANAWTITPAGKTYGPPSPAIFYTGPISGYPSALQARIKSAGIATKTYLGFGYIQGGSINTDPNGCPWATNALFGVYVIGSQLVIDSFSECSSDYKTYQAEISYIHN